MNTMRKIIAYNTLGDNMSEVYSGAQTWGELQSDLNRAGIRYEGMRIMTNPGQVTLESLQAELPQGEFQLFIMPQKVKSGRDEDEGYIDEDDGMFADDENWETHDPEECTFVNRKELALARSKRAFALLEKAINYLGSGSSPKPTSTHPSDPMLEKLREQARNLQNNIMFD